MADVMDNYIENNPLLVSSPKFHTDMDYYIISIIIQTIGHLYIDKDSLEYEIYQIYESVKNNFY